jgi:hypothetical protein
MSKEPVMRINRTDIFATFAVGIGMLAYALWLADVAIPGLGSARVVGAVVLGLGWLASAVAVVPNFDELIRSSRIYLVITSALGVAALTAGIIVLVTASETMLALLVWSTAAMWVLATIRHTLVTRRESPAVPTTTVEERELVGSSQ